MPIRDHLFDKRIVKRALQEGLLDKAAYQRVLDELPDVAYKIQTPDANDDSARASAVQDSAPGLV
jgi:hypothetical protein